MHLTLHYSKKLKCGKPHNRQSEKKIKFISRVWLLKASPDKLGMPNHTFKFHLFGVVSRKCITSNVQYRFSTFCWLIYCRLFLGNSHSIIDFSWTLILPTIQQKVLWFSIILIPFWNTISITRLKANYNGVVLKNDWKSICIVGEPFEGHRVPTAPLEVFTDQDYVWQRLKKISKLEIIDWFKK